MADLFMTLPDMDGYEVSPGIFLIGQPTPVPGTQLMRALANVYGALAIIELKIKFREPQNG
jgi:hypothetical protein